MKTLINRQVSCRRHPMTLIEMMTAVVIASLVFAMLYGMLAHPMGLWHKAMAQWRLEQQSRLLRERMLRGIDYQFGLREAERGSIKIQPGKTEQVEWINFDVDDGDFPGTTSKGGGKGKGKGGGGSGGSGSESVRCFILKNPGHNLAARTTPGSGQPKPILRDSVTCEKLEFTEQGRQLRVDYTLSIKAGGETYTKRNVMSVTMLNE